MKIIFHWVWAWLNMSHDNTYFLLQDWDEHLQVDCWGGLWLARKLKYWVIDFSNLFISHKHLDHIMWFFQLARVKNHLFNVYCSKDTQNTIEKISEILWSKNKMMLESSNVIFNNIDSLKKQKIWNFDLEPINLYSEKIEQFWFLLNYSWLKIVFFWDEAVNILNRDDLDKFEDVDYLIIEAVSPEYMAKRSWGDIDTEKMHHITAKQAWDIWTRLKAKNIILIHTMDICSKNRQEILLNDAKQTYNWNIIVPNCWDVVEL